MASGRINRNDVLELDSQLEGVGGCWRRRRSVGCQHTIAWSNVVFGPSSDPDDTELPRLTSDHRLRRSAGGV